MSDTRLTEIIPFRCTAEQRWQWENAAARAGLTLSEFLRQGADEKVERVKIPKKGKGQR